MFAFYFPTGTGDIVKLSDVLEKEVDQKYYLTESQTKFTLDPMRLKKKYTSLHQQ
jgi:hypothetical protein